MVQGAHCSGQENELCRCPTMDTVTEQGAQVVCSKIRNLIYVEVMCSMGSSQLMTESGRNTKAGPHLEDKVTPLMGSFGLKALSDSLVKLPQTAGLSRALATNLPWFFPSLRVRFAYGFISSELYPVLHHTDMSSNKIPEHLFCHLLFEDPCDIPYVIKLTFYG